MLMREDVENVIETNSGRYFIVPEEFLFKAMRAKGMEDELSVVRRVMEGGGDLVDLETGPMCDRKIKVVKRWRVDHDGNNEAVIEMRAADLGGHRYLMRGEPTREEYISSRIKELGLKGAEIAAKYQQLSDEYKDLTSS